MTGRRLLLILVVGTGLAGVARAEPGEWKQVGNAGDWKDTAAGVRLHNRIYTVEKNGGLYVTDPATGGWKQLGKAEFANTTLMLAAGGKLYTIESDGSLYRVSPNDGSWEQVGDAGAWKDTIAGVSLDNRIYTVEKNGGLYVTDPATGGWKQLGKADFANTTLMFAAGGKLYTIESDGSLYRVSPTDGSWEQVGDAGAWKDTIAGVTLDNRIYTVEKNGGLYVTDPANGGWTQLGKADFANTAFLFAARGKLDTIETDGSLYEVSIN